MNYSVALEAFERLYIPEPNSGCWLWLFGVSSNGYGCYYPEEKRSNPLGHRGELAPHYSYRIHKGPPGKLHVLHSCDNRLCVNPDHLFLGTAADNLQDMAKKGRAGGQKLSVTDVLAIRADQRKQTEICKDYGISNSLVCKIKLRRCWGHV